MLDKPHYLRGIATLDGDDPRVISVKSTRWAHRKVQHTEKRSSEMSNNGTCARLCRDAGKPSSRLLLEGMYGHHQPELFEPTTAVRSSEIAGFSDVYNALYNYLRAAECSRPVYSRFPRGVRNMPGGLGYRNIPRPG